jgi:hypothetical protein
MHPHHSAGCPSSNGGSACADPWKSPRVRHPRSPGLVSSEDFSERPCPVLRAFNSCHRQGDAVDPIETGPSVCPPAVVANKYPAFGGVNCLHEVDVDASRDPREHDVTCLHESGIDGRDHDFVPASDQRHHRVPSGMEGHRFSRSDSLGNLLEHDLATVSTCTRAASTSAYHSCSPLPASAPKRRCHCLTAGPPAVMT